jgi:hypothetical protein
MPNIWFLIVPALVLLLIGCKLGPKDVHDRSAEAGRLARLGNILSVLAAFLVILGLFASVKGPYFFGPVVLPSSPMVQKALKFQANTEAFRNKSKNKHGSGSTAMKDSYANASEYAFALAQIKGTFSMGRCLRFDGQCRNTGNKDLNSIEITFSDTAKHTVRRSVSRPFLSGQEVTFACALPDMFQMKGARFEVTGASY